MNDRFVFVPPAVREHITVGLERVPDPVTREWLVAQCTRLEKHLRNQYREPEREDDKREPFPPMWEQELAALRVGDITGALQRWAYLKHLYRVRSEGLEAAAQALGDDEGGAQEVARLILRRAPVVTELAGRRVEVTSRSYSAMAEISAHDLRLQDLNEAMESLVALNAEAQARLRTTPIMKRARRHVLRRRLARISALYRRFLTERELHRMHMYAHALTTHGGPAQISVTESGEHVGDLPPEWWREMTAEDDARLMIALYRAGPLRYKKLGRAPEPKSGGRAQYREDFGLGSLMAHWEPELGLAPGDLFDRDLAQFLTALRAGALELPELSRN